MQQFHAETTDVSVKATVDYPFSLDLKFYRSANSDLEGFSDHDLRAHFYIHGIHEGRPGSPCVFREKFLSLVSKTAHTLEIGPFCSPVLRGPNVKYFDVAERDALIQRAILHHQGHTDPPVIDYVSPTGDMAVIDEEFDQIFSSHCVEHQPNLIRHFNQVERLLRKGGSYFLIVPDKRFCFDHFLPETTIADVLSAQIEQKILHSPRSVLEHRHLTTHNDPVRHWHGDHGTPAIQTQDVDTVLLWIDQLAKSGDAYLDVHAWHFTPAVFEDVVNQLYRLGLSKLRADRIYNTPAGRFEFCAILSNH